MATTAESPATTPCDIRFGWLAAGRELRGAAALVLAAMLLTPSGAIFFRRCCGAFDRPLSFPILASAGLLVFLGGEILWRLVEHRPKADTASRVVPLAGAASGWMLAAGLSLRGSSLTGLFILWALVILETGLSAWRIHLRSSSAVGSAVRTKCALHVETAERSFVVRTADPTPKPGTTAGLSSSAEALRHSTTLLDKPAVAPEIATARNEIEAAPPAAIQAASDDAPLPPGVTQQLVRREEPDGAHWLSGMVRMKFDSGQRVTHAHVAFCPPFLTTPTCEAETVSGPDAEVKVSQLLPHGVRFEARLDEAAAEPSDVVIEFATHWPAS